MTVKNERGKEARQYFISCETGLKIATQKLQSQNEVNFTLLTNAITQLTKNIFQMQQDISDLKQSYQAKYLPSKNIHRHGLSG